MDEALQGRGTQLVCLVHAATCKLSAARTHRSQLHVKAVQISGKSSNQANLKFAWSAKFNFVCFRSRTPLLHNTHLIGDSTRGPSFLSDPRLFVALPCPLTHLVRLFKPCASAMLGWKWEKIKNPIAQKLKDHFRSQLPQKRKMRRATGKSHSKIEQCTAALNTKADHPKSAVFLDQMLLLCSINDNALPVLDTSSFHYWTIEH